MIKWDTDWLKMIRDTRKMIDAAGPHIQEIPDPVDREIVRRQFHVLVNRFKADVDMGYNPRESSTDIFQIADLILELIKDRGLEGVG